MRPRWIVMIVVGVGKVAANPNLWTQLRYQDLKSSLGQHTDGTPIDPYSTRKHIRKSFDATEAQSIKTEYAILPIDHFGDNQGTFKNRFWVSTTDYKPGGPVFVFDGGEGDASDGVEYYLEDDNSFFKQMKRKYHGMGIVWEHRYYGQSYPDIPGVSNSSAEAYRYLTTEQALADVPAFAWNFSRSDIKQDLTPNGSPWVFVGGSYPGMRAAFLRNMYPGSIFASYASSAPVQASMDMSFYWEPVWQGLKHYGFSNCSQDVHNTILAIDDMLDDPEQAEAIKIRFLGAGAEANSNGGFGDTLSAVFYPWQSYGIDAKFGSVRSFCDWISTDPETNQTAPAEGWALTKGLEWTLKRWLTWPKWITTVNVLMQSNCTGPAEGAPPDLAIMKANSKPKTQAQLQTVNQCNFDTATEIDHDTRSWTWQYCTQWGYLQYTNLGDHQLASKNNDLERTLKWCSQVFPDGHISGLLPEEPAADATNEKFGGWSIRPSQTFWTAGQFDPWTTLSPFSQLKDAPLIQTTEVVPECAAPPMAIPDEEKQHSDDDEETDDEGSRGSNGISKGAEHKFGHRRGRRDGRRYRPGRRSGQSTSRTFEDAKASWPVKRHDETPLFGRIIPEAQHCYDFRTTAPRFNEARAVFDKALTKWLGCFKPGVQTPGTNSKLDGSGSRFGSLVRRAVYP